MLWLDNCPRSIWYSICHICYEKVQYVIKRRTFESFLKGFCLISKAFPKGRIIVDTSYPDHSIYAIEDHPNWKDSYPEAEEEIPNDLPSQKGPKVRMIVYVDADHEHDKVTRRSITGILVMLNNTLVQWVSRRQKTIPQSNLPRRYFFQVPSTSLQLLQVSQTTMLDFSLFAWRFGSFFDYLKIWCQ